MKTTKPKSIYISILLCVFVINAMAISLVHAAQTIPGVERLEEGIAAYEHGEYDDAIFKLEMAVYQISVDDKEDLWDAHFYLGLLYHLTGDNDESAKQFSKAQGLIKNKLPDVFIHSPKIIKLFKETLKPKQVGVWKDPITDMAFVFVKGGCYEMGDTFGDGSEDERPVHEVCLDDFYIGKYEVTQGQWEEVMGDNPSHYQNGSNYPVESVSWDDVHIFIKELNKKTGQNYRLPTEAEWEYAARSGGKSEKYAGFSKEFDISIYARFSDNYDGNTHPGGQKKPNGLGLYVMSGNVSEWCQDWYGENYYRSSSKDNPKGPSSGSRRVVRGGGWGSRPGNLRASHRGSTNTDFRGYDLGFRLARTVD